MSKVQETLADIVAAALRPHRDGGETGARQDARQYGYKTVHGFKWAYANSTQMPYEKGDDNASK